MLKRIKTLVKAFKGHYDGIPDNVSWKKLEPEEKEELYNEADGNAEFLGVGTQEEYKRQLEEDKGFKGIFGL